MFKSIMCIMTVQKWVGFISSLVCSVQSGIFLSFNVVAVPLKARFQLTQTQVELVGSFSVGGLALIVIGFLIVEKFGHVAAYFTAWSLMMLSGLLLWTATMYESFVSDNVWILCLLQVTNCTGAVILLDLCCVGVSVINFHPRHVGKVTSLYFACGTLGKIYYAAIYAIFFKDENHLGEFFLSVPIGISVTILICSVFHRPAAEISDQKQNNTEQEKKDEPVKTTRKLSIKKILASKFFHSFFWINVLFLSCTFCLMNSITAISQSVSTLPPEYMIVILAVGTTVSRVGFGVIFDYYASEFSTVLLLLICYVTFAIAMLLGLVQLDETTVYIFTVLASVGVGAGFSLAIGTLTAVFGSINYSSLISMFQFAIFILTTVISVLVGVLFGQAEGLQGADERLCLVCFYWSFVLFLCVGLLAIGLTPLIYIVWKKELPFGRSEMYQQLD